MRPLGYLVPLMVLCAALGAQVADVVAAAKKTPAPAARGAAALGAAPTAAAVVATSHQAGAGAGAGPTTKTSTLTASSLPAAHPAPAAKGLASSADKKKTKPHRTASTAGGRRPAGGEDTTSGGGPDLGRSGLALAAATVGGAGQGVTAASDRDSRPDSDSAPDGAVLKSSVTSRTPTKQGAYPFLVAVQRICGSCQTRHSCGGVLLAPQWVLGVAQCAETQPGEYLVVRAGESFIWPGGQTPTQKVVEVVWHEAPSSTDDYPRYDLILLRLENPFTFGEFINAINMAPPSHSIDGPVSVAGWSPPGSAQQVEVNVTHATVRPVEECSRITSQETLLADTLCAQPVEPFLDKCAYDLGDPVIVEGDNPLLVGVLSRWYQPCSPERPVVAIKISVAYAWIFEKVPDLVPAPAPAPSQAPPAGPGSPGFWPESLCCGPWLPWKPKPGPGPGR